MNKEYIEVYIWSCLDFSKTTWASPVHARKFDHVG